VLVAIRNPTDVAGRMMVFAYMGATCGLVFWRMGDGRGMESLQNRVNVLFIMALQFLLMPYVYMSLYTADKRHYTADISARLYKPGPYYIAKTLATLPFMVANVLVSGVGASGLLGRCIGLLRWTSAAAYQPSHPSTQLNQQFQTTPTHQTQICTYTAYGMTGLSLSQESLIINGATSVLLYLIAQQVHSLATIVMPNEDTSFLVTGEGWRGGWSWFWRSPLPAGL